MKILKLNCMLFVITSFIFFSCEQGPNRRSYTGLSGDQSHNNQGIETNDFEQEDPLSYEELEALEKMENDLKTDYMTSFKEIKYSLTRSIFLVQLPMTVNKEEVIKRLEDYEEKAERFLDNLTRRWNGISFSDKIRLKLIATKYFLENHGVDTSFYIKPPKPSEENRGNSGESREVPLQMEEVIEENPEIVPPPAREEIPPSTFVDDLPFCPELEGQYVAGGGQKSIEIGKIDCKSFMLKTFEKEIEKNIKVRFTEMKLCKFYGIYKVCSQGVKASANELVFVINETWEDPKCEVKKYLKFALPAMTLTSKIGKVCKNDSSMNFTRETVYERERN